MKGAELVLSPLADVTVLMRGADQRRLLGSGDQVLSGD
jgi:hypothetical protein